MDAVFYNRDQSHRIKIPLDFVIERYSWNMIGGPDKAYMNAPKSADDWDWMKLLRAPVEIWDEGKCLWWGYVNRVTVPRGDEQRVGLGLDELYNHVTVAYADGDTSAASDTESIAEYGQKETRLNDINATQTEAEQTRGIYLANHQYARPEIEFSGGDDNVRIECYGWYSTLGWKYYSSSDNANTENTTQIANIVSSAGQFFRGAIIEDIANTTSNAFRDGTNTALTYINQLLNAGTTNTRPLLAYVDRDRYLHVYERQPEPPTNKPDYLMRSDSKLITPLGQVVADKECKTAVWVKIADVLDTLGGFSAMRPFYLESAEYNLERDKTTYRAANSYEQVRLAKYIADTISGRGGGSSGSLIASDLFYPFLQEAHPRRLHRYGSSTSDIASSSGVFLNLSSIPDSSGDLTYYGTSIFVPGQTDDLGNPGWKIIYSGVYNFLIYLTFSNGTASPATGDIRVRLYQRGNLSITLFNDYIPIPAGGSVLADIPMFWIDKLVAGRYLGLSITNFTNGDITVQNAELIATLERFTGEPST